MNMRSILLYLGLIGLGIILIANLGSFGQFLENMKRVQWYLVPLVAILQLASYYANARFYKAFFRLSHFEVDTVRLVKTSLAINFANQVIPAGGVAGTTYLSKTLADVVPAGKSTLSQLGKYIFGFLTNIPLLALGMIIIFFSGSITDISVRLVLFLTTVVVIAGIIAISYLSDRSRMRRVVRPVIRTYNKAGTFLFRKTFKPLDAVGVGNFFDEFYLGYQNIMSQKRGWVALFIWAILGNIMEMATLYATFIGFGIWPNLGIVILGYQIAIAASLIGPLTAGAGALEFGMIAGFTALGVPFALSFAVVLTYRFLKMIITLTPGFYYYRKGLA